jgi:hypothetical protein
VRAVTPNENKVSRGWRERDEGCTRVKTDPRDAATLCQRLSRYLEGNTRELAVIRVPVKLSSHFGTV